MSYEYNSGTGALIKLTDTKGNKTIMKYNMLGQKTDVYDPDMGHMNYYYNANGAIIEAVDANANVTRYTYDEIGRNTRIDYPNSIDGKKNYDLFIYDAVSGGEYRAGKLVAVWKYVNSGSSYQEYFYYDENDNVEKNIRGIIVDAGFIPRRNPIATPPNDA